MKLKDATSKFTEEILDIVDITIKSFPTFFVDSNFKKKDRNSCIEINRLVAWVHQLKSLDVNKVKHPNNEIKKTEIEKTTRITKNIEGNVENIKTEYFERKKETRYDGIVIYSDWIKVKEENTKNVLPRKLEREEIQTNDEFFEEFFTPPSPKQQ